MVEGNTIVTGESPFSVGVFMESSERNAQVFEWTVTDNDIQAGASVGDYSTSAPFYVIVRGDPAVGLVARNRASASAGWLPS
ncbi:hypothetical protein D3C83_125840 [compost metagenome]